MKMTSPQLYLRLLGYVKPYWRVNSLEGEKGVRLSGGYDSMLQWNCVYQQPCCLRIP